MDIELIKKISQKKLNSRENKCLIGTEIKKRRLETNKTLEMVSEGICCKSYLSKLENATVMMKDSYIEEIMKKVDYKGSQNYITDEQYYSYLSSLVEAYASRNSAIIDEVFNKIIDHRTGYYQDVLNFICYVYKGSYKEAASLIDGVLLYGEQLSIDSIRIFLLFLVAYHLKTKEPFTAKQVIDVLVKYKMEAVNELIIFSKCDIQIDLVLQYPYDLSNKITKMFSLFTANNYFLEENEMNYATCKLLEMGAVDIVNTYLPRLCKNTRQLVEAFYSYLENDYAKGIKKMSGVKKNKYYYFLYAFLCDLNSDHNKLVEELNQMPSFVLDTMSEEEMLFLNLLKTKNEIFDTFPTRKYLKETVLPYSFEIHNVFLMKYFSNMYIDLLADESLYKEAVLSYKKLTKSLNDIYRTLWMHA